VTLTDLQRYYDVSLPPSLWGGGAAPEARAVAETKALPADPDAFTIAQIEEWVADNPDEVDAVLAAEVAGKNRTTLVAWLEDQLMPDEDPEA
jgi:hypothetical protein